MTRASRIQFVLGGLLVVVGIALATLPKDWIEERFGFEPDGGNGLAELLILAVPIVLGVVLIIRAFMMRRRASGVVATASGEQAQD